jgi:hypothetical protein
VTLAILLKNLLRLLTAYEHTSNCQNMDTLRR